MCECNPQKTKSVVGRRDMESPATGVAVAVIALLVTLSYKRGGDALLQHSAVPEGGNPYAILGVPNDASKQAITKAYRALALKWHPDRNSDDPTADASFALISHAYDVLTDPEKREVYDRLGETGLERLRDGDPSVRKDWLPPDEVLRRIHNDGDEPWLQSWVTSGFATLATGVDTVGAYATRLAAQLGVDRRPAVVISATEDATGAALHSGGSARGDVTFRFTLSGKSFDFSEASVTHTCANARFLGMKTTFYLQCAYVAGQTLAVSVAANVFSLTGRQGTNGPSEVFRLDME